MLLVDTGGGDGGGLSDFGTITGCTSSRAGPSI